MNFPQKNATDLELRFQLAKELAEEAGAVALDYFQRRDELVIETKRDPQDVVSVADRSVEALLRKRIESAFPEDGILGEEYGLLSGTGRFTWVIDPIDGTAPFVNGLPNWCVSIALLADEEPVIGVIKAACDDELFAAMKGKGASVNGRSLILNATKTLQNGLTGIGGNSHVPPAMVGASITRLLEAGGNFVRTGSGALMLAHVAAGRLVGYFEPYMHAWDCLAGYCLVKEAGGDHLPFPVQRDALQKGSPVLAAGPGAFRELVELVPHIDDF
ncbi:MAG: inositol monophosphatase [Roseibium sp.]|nr:inositol monophosphatase [Roseibium sp.]